MTLKIAKEQKAQIINLIQTYFREERGEELGDLAAEFMLDFIVGQIGPYIYNQAIADVQAMLLQRMSVLEDDLYALKKPISLPYQKKV